MQNIKHMRTRINSRERSDSITLLCWLFVILNFWEIDPLPLAGSVSLLAGSKCNWRNCNCKHNISSPSVLDKPYKTAQCRLTHPVSQKNQLTQSSYGNKTSIRTNVNKGVVWIVSYLHNFTCLHQQHIFQPPFYLTYITFKKCYSIFFLSKTYPK